MTEKAAPDEGHQEVGAAMGELATSAGTMSIQPRSEIEDPMAPQGTPPRPEPGPPRVAKTPSTVGVPLVLVYM